LLQLHTLIIGGEVGPQKFAFMGALIAECHFPHVGHLGVVDSGGRLPWVNLLFINLDTAGDPLVASQNGDVRTTALFGITVQSKCFEMRGVTLDPSETC
jgi:hypothetical protein